MLENEKALSALDAVCCHLRADPGSYDQGDWGNGTPDCETPGCVAGYLVAVTRAGREAYERLTKPLGPNASDTQRGDAVREAATEALGLDETPRLFEPDWPREWLEAADMVPGDRLSKRIEPGPDTALAVLGTIMDGDLDEALRPSTSFGEPGEAPKEERRDAPRSSTPGAGNEG